MNILLTLLPEIFLVQRRYADETPVAGSALKFNEPRDLCEKRVIGTHSHIFSGVEFCPALADYYRACVNFLVSVNLDASALTR